MAISLQTKRFLEKNKSRQRPRQFIVPRPRYVQPQPSNMFQAGEQPTFMESSMDLLFGGEGEREVGRQQAVFPTLPDLTLDDVMMPVMDELNMNPQPQRRMMRRRR